MEAFRILKQKNIRDIDCTFWGEGDLRESIENQIVREGLQDWIKIGGYIENKKLLKAYEERRYDAVLLPSLSLSAQEHEGIPVSLMEAMAYEIPVISTNTGGIPELLSKGAGIMIEQKVRLQLLRHCCAQRRIKNFMLPCRKRSRERVSKEFNNELNTQRLLRYFRKPSMSKRRRP
ncbi:MAG: glycosyltransferase [Clostridia bacterium]